MSCKVKSVVYVALAVCAIAVIGGVNAQQEYTERDLANMIDQVDHEKSLYLFGGLSIVKSKNARSLNQNRNMDVLEKAFDYMETHELNFDYNDERQMGDARSGKLKKIAIPLLLALKMKMALILPIVLKALTLISVKGLITGTLALIFSGFTLLRDFFNKKPREQVTTAYITGANPIAAEIIQQDNWNRNGQASAQELAYNYHTLPGSNF